MLSQNAIPPKIIDGLKFAQANPSFGGRDFEMQKKENGYLTEINELLRKK